LHLHTNKSDGAFTPKDLVYFLYTKGIKVISITDHDSVEGIEEGLREARILGIELIPGIELSAEYKGEEVHVLGYYIDTKSEFLQNYLKKFREARKERFLKMLEKLKKLGIELEVDLERFDSEKSIGRPHLAQELVKGGFVSSVEEAFQKYLGDNGPAYVKKFKIEVSEAIEIIHKSGGIAVLAHPGLLNRFEEVIDLSVLSGIDGIEVFHPKNPQYMEDRLREIAFKNNLMITGGTDFHGTLEEPGYLDDFKILCEVENRMLKRVVKG